MTLARRLPTLALVAALVTALVALTPLAHAEPPDPTWVSGFFDDDDNDNGVFFITSSLATLDAFPLCCWTPFPVFGPAVAPLSVQLFPVPSYVHVWLSPVEPP